MMLFFSSSLLFLLSLLATYPPLLLATTTSSKTNTSTTISPSLFASLEQLSRLVDISYCVGTTGISRPFSCASRCADFPGWELVDTFLTGWVLGDGCGFLVVHHGDGAGGDGKQGLRTEEDSHGDDEGVGKREDNSNGRIVVAFRGTYSLANTIVDLSTVPQEYVPYPEDPDANPDEDENRDGNGNDEMPSQPSWLSFSWSRSQPARKQHKRNSATQERNGPKCRNCTVHSGFLTSWHNTRPYVIPHLKDLHTRYPEYEIHLVGHSLGGAIAALAGLELEGMGFRPTVTTFGEPRVGNVGLRDWIDGLFDLSPPSQTQQTKQNHISMGNEEVQSAGRYRRVTHINDPVPLLPLHEWGYRSHAGEIYISKDALQPSVADLRLCVGDDDPACIAGADSGVAALFNDNTPPVEREEMMDELRAALELDGNVEVDAEMENSLLRSDGEERGDEELEKQRLIDLRKRWGVPIPARYKVWQLLFAHRDYFWRLGLCVPGGDALNWGKGRYRFDEGGGEDGDGYRGDL